MRVPEPERLAQYLMQPLEPIIRERISTSYEMYCAPSHSTCRHVGSVGARADCFPHIGKRCRCVGYCTDVPEIEHLRPLSRHRQFAASGGVWGRAEIFFCPVIARRRKPMLTRLALRKPMLMCWVPR